MQLPQSQFHHAIMSISTQAMMEEMTSERFTGVCMVISGAEGATLVFREGLAMLAEHDGLAGQQALDKILRDGEGGIVAEMSLLTPAQVQSILESNRSFATGHQSLSSPGKVDPENGVTIRSESPAAEYPNLAPEMKPMRETPAPPLSGDDEMDMLVRAMEEVDVEQLLDSFRANCEDILKEIRLDHLILERSK